MAHIQERSFAGRLGTRREPPVIAARPERISAISFSTLRAHGVELDPHLTESEEEDGQAAERGIRQVASSMVILHEDLVNIGDLLLYEHYRGLIDSASLTSLLAGSWPGVELPWLPAGDGGTIGAIWDDAWLDRQLNVASLRSMRDTGPQAPLTDNMMMMMLGLARRNGSGRASGYVLNEGMSEQLVRVMREIWASHLLAGTSPGFTTGGGGGGRGPEGRVVNEAGDPFVIVDIDPLPLQQADGSVGLAAPDMNHGPNDKVERILQGLFAAVIPACLTSLADLCKDACPAYVRFTAYTGLAGVTAATYVALLSRTRGAAALRLAACAGIAALTIGATSQVTETTHIAGVCVGGGVITFGMMLFR